MSLCEILQCCCRLVLLPVKQSKIAYDLRVIWIQLIRFVEKGSSFIIFLLTHQIATSIIIRKSQLIAHYLQFAGIAPFEKMRSRLRKTITKVVDKVACIKCWLLIFRYYL